MGKKRERRISSLAGTIKMVWAPQEHTTAAGDRGGQAQAYLPTVPDGVSLRWGAALPARRSWLAAWRDGWCRTGRQPHCQATVSSPDMGDHTLETLHLGGHESTHPHFTRTKIANTLDFWKRGKGKALIKLRDRSPCVLETVYGVVDSLNASFSSLL